MPSQTLTGAETIIMIVVGTVPIVYAFTHHGRARRNALAL